MASDHPSDFDTSWEIEKYRNEFECDDHWHMRRRFLIAHKDKFPEQRLICLAQIFFNIELLGCTYPGNVQNLVIDLSEGIADDFRQKREKRLKRTFVQASDAAQSKAKGRNKK